jgi:hypothetical protein
MSSRGRTLGLRVARVRDRPLTSCSLGLWGRSGHWSDCHAGDHLVMVVVEEGGVVGKSLLPAPVTGPVAPAPSKATFSAMPCSRSFRSQLCPSAGRNRYPPQELAVVGTIIA